MDAYEFRLLRAQDGLDLATQEGRTQYALTACGILKRVKNPVELENYVAIVAQRTGFERDVLYRQIGASPVERSPAVRPRRVAPPKSPPDYVLAQQRLVALKAANLLPEGTVCPEDFDDAVCRALFEGLSAGERRASWWAKWPRAKTAPQRWARWNARRCRRTRRWPWKWRGNAWPASAGAGWKSRSPRCGKRSPPRKAHSAGNCWSG